MISAGLRNSPRVDIWHSSVSWIHGQPILMSCSETLDLGNLQWMTSCSPEPFQTSSAPKNCFPSIRRVLSPGPSVWDSFLLMFFLQWTGNLERRGKNRLPVMLSLNVCSGNCFFGRNVDKSYISFSFSLEMHKKNDSGHKAVLLPVNAVWGNLVLLFLFHTFIWEVFLAAFLSHRQ